MYSRFYLSFSVVITATSSVTLIVWYLILVLIFLCLLMSPIKLTENLKVVKNVQDHEYFKYFIIMLLVNVK